MYLSDPFVDLPSDRLIVVFHVAFATEESPAYVWSSVSWTLDLVDRANRSFDSPDVVVASALTNVIAFNDCHFESSSKYGSPITTNFRHDG